MSERGNRRVVIGVVTSDKMDKTRRVEIARLVKHVRYGKYIRRRTICRVHDENNESQKGDRVEIMESRPISKTKSWRMIRIVEKAPGHGEGQRPTAAVQEESVPEGAGQEAEATPE